MTGSPDQALRAWGRSKPWWMAQSAACVRLAALILRSNCLTEALTTISLSDRCVAIMRLLSPLTSRRRISASRTVRPRGALRTRRRHDQRRQDGRDQDLAVHHAVQGGCEFSRLQLLGQESLNRQFAGLTQALQMNGGTQHDKAGIRHRGPQLRDRLRIVAAGIDHDELRGRIGCRGTCIASSMEAYSATTWYRVASSRRTSPWRNSRCGSISRVGTGFIGILHRGNLSVRKPCVAGPGSELLHKPTLSLVFFMSPAFMSQDRACHRTEADRRRCSGSSRINDHACAPEAGPVRAWERGFSPLDGYSYLRHFALQGAVVTPPIRFAKPLCRFMISHRYHRSQGRARTAGERAGYVGRSTCV